MLALQPIIFECPPLKKKDQQSGDIKDSDVDPIRGLAECAVVGVKQYRNHHQSQQKFRQLDAPVVSLIPKKRPLDQQRETVARTTASYAPRWIR